MPQTLAQMVRSKHPGAYDDLSDQQLEQAVITKYPGTYDDLPRTTVSATPKADASRARVLPPGGPGAAPVARQTATQRTPVVGRGSNIDLTRPYDVAGGVRAGAAYTVYGGGDIIRRTVGADRVIDRPEVQAAMTPPDSTAGRLGFLAEQTAEFAIPLARVSKAVAGARLLPRMAAEGAAAAGVAGLQSGGDSGSMAMAGTMGAALPAASQLVRAGGRVVQRAAAGAREGGVGGALAGAVRNVAPGEPRTLLVQALKPRSTRVNFHATLDRAMPELKAAEWSIGKSIDGVDDLLEASRAAKSAIQGQLNQLRGPQHAMGAQVDLTPVANAMAKSIPRKVQLESPAAAKRLIKTANVYRRPFSLEDAEVILRETNAELDSFYQMYPQARTKALTANPATAQLEAQAKALRDAIYRKLDDPGQGAAARELNRRYGALMEVEGEAYRRLNVAARQQPESLSEQIGAVRAAGEMARGTWKLLHGDVTGAADIAAGTAGRAAAKAIKESQTTNALIKRAFANYAGWSRPVVMPPPQMRGPQPTAPRVAVTPTRFY